MVPPLPDQNPPRAGRPELFQLRPQTRHRRAHAAATTTTRPTPQETHHQTRGL